MKSRGLMGALILLCLFGVAADDVPRPAGNPHVDRYGWETLFDGKALDAWDTTGQSGIWAVNPEGELYVAGVGKALFTKRRYCDFVLELDFKVASGKQGNSGVFIRTHDKKDEVHTGMEVQILDDADYGYKWNSVDATGSLYDLVAPSVNAAKPPGEWNHYKIIAKGSHIIVDLNGQEIIKADLDRWTTVGRNPDGTVNKFRYAIAALPREGFIGLQNHGGLPAWFRNIRIKPLTDRKPLYTGEEPIKQVLNPVTR